MTSTFLPAVTSGHLSTVQSLSEANAKAPAPETELDRLRRAAALHEIFLTAADNLAGDLWAASGSQYGALLGVVSRELLDLHQPRRPAPGYGFAAGSGLHTCHGCERTHHGRSRPIGFPCRTYLITAQTITAASGLAPAGLRRVP